MYGVHEKDWEAKAILWSRSDSVAPADLFSSSTQEMPCLTSMITLFNKDQSMHHPLTFGKGERDSVCEGIPRFFYLPK